MASNRSNLVPRPAVPADSEPTPGDALATLARQGVRMHIAALLAAEQAVAGWALSADRLAQVVGDELLRRVDRETDSRRLVVNVAAATNEHLRELAALPGAAADHFDARLARTSTNTQEVSR
jgi:hypothetical protein